jgi:hypothetical protein
MTDHRPRLEKLRSATLKYRQSLQWWRFWVSDRDIRCAFADLLFTIRGVSGVVEHCDLTDAQRKELLVALDEAYAVHERKPH